MAANEQAGAEAPLVLHRDDGGVTTLTLNRGERFNPLSSEMIAALDGQLEAVAADRSVRAVVLAGVGRGFCAGHDLKQMRAHAEDKAWQQRLFNDCSRMMVRLIELPQPIIARVHGIATAAGCQLVSMCDLAVAAEEARFALPGVNVGIFCSTPAVRVARNIGRKRAMEMLLTGAPFDAATALAWELVNRVVPAAALDAEVARFTGIILERSGKWSRPGSGPSTARSSSRWPAPTPPPARPWPAACWSRTPPRGSTPSSASVRRAGPPADRPPKLRPGPGAGRRPRPAGP